MYKTCKYCGIVSVDHKCPHKIIRKQNRTQARDRFRNSAAWQKKRDEIKIRDLFLCRICKEDLYNTINQLNSMFLEVHHITPLHEDYTKRLDNDNLITLCAYHHKLAEKGEIPREILSKLITQTSPPT